MTQQSSDMVKRGAPYASQTEAWNDALEKAAQIVERYNASFSDPECRYAPGDIRALKRDAAEAAARADMVEVARAALEASHHVEMWRALEAVRDYYFFANPTRLTEAQVCDMVCTVLAKIGGDA